MKCKSIYSGSGARLAWGYLAPGIPPAKRERVWKTVESLSKWSFIDVFVVVLLVVAFKVRISLATPNAKFKGGIYVEPARRVESTGISSGGIHLKTWNFAQESGCVSDSEGDLFFSRERIKNADASAGLRMALSRK